MSRMPAKAKTSRLTREDWIVQALDLIGREGMRAVSIDRLAGELGVTKGSFYWHFKNRDEFVSDALEYWEERWTDRGQAALDEMPDPRERLRALFQAVLRSHEHGALNISLHDNASDPAVKPIVERVTAKRIEFLGRAYSQMGFDDAEAHFRAAQAYATYVGLHEVLRAHSDPLRGDDHDRFIQHLIEQLVPA